VGGSSNDNCLSSGKGKELVAKARGQARREALCILIEFFPQHFPPAAGPPIHTYVELFCLPPSVTEKIKSQHVCSYACHSCADALE